MLFNIMREDEILKWSEAGQNQEFEYVMKNGILRETGVYSEAQKQTKNCFSFKWNKRDTYESEAVSSSVQEWLQERYWFGNQKMFEQEVVPDNCKLLDAGCGAGMSALSLFGERLNRIHYLGVDISDAVDVAKTRFKEADVAGEFLQADLNHLPIPDGSMDVIFSEGVLHHTDSVSRSLQYLSCKLKRGGRFLFYVYAKKAPVREFVDDHIRNYFKDRSDEEMWEGLMPLTKLGEQLGRLNVMVEVEEIPYLGIPAGKMDLQRFFYWYFCKAYYRPNFSQEEMNHINFDWYRPANCHRQTPEEVLEWCMQAGLKVEQIKVEDAGITVIARKI